MATQPDNSLQPENPMEQDPEDTAENGDESSHEVEPMAETGSTDNQKVDDAPDCKTQKEEIQVALQQKLVKGDSWYLVDIRWMKQWKKYVGYDAWDQSAFSQASSNPGPVDNSVLFRDRSRDLLKDHLMEELDYYLVPKPAWEKLVSWYGISESSQPIERKVVEHGLYMKHCKVEVYLMEFKLCQQSQLNETVFRQFSRATTVAELEATMREVFNVPKEVECRVWHRYMTNTYEELNKPNQTLQDASLYSGQTLVLEKKNPDGTWPRSSQPATVGNQSNLSAADVTGYSSRSTQSTEYGSSSTFSSASYYYQQPSAPGLCGLGNLGNTCFMNSTLQCLSNTVPLTEYFLGDITAQQDSSKNSKPYEKDINAKNPLGMGGAIARAYGDLLEDLWGGKLSAVAPRNFKTQVGRFAPQFVGYAQHDSQELLAFLLDGLHEDLNLVREKPYVDMSIATAGRTDKEVADESWIKYLLRNQSVIVKFFQGQLKSTVICPSCEHVSRTFDPFLFLSLPLPVKSERTMYISLVRVDPDQPVYKYKLILPKRECVAFLKSTLHKLTNIDPKLMVVMDVYNSRFHRLYDNKDPLSQILDRDDIYIYEIAHPLNDPDYAQVPIYHREATTKEVKYTYQSYTQRYTQLFGLPLVVEVPRDKCTYRTLYDAIMNRCRMYVRKWSDGTKAVTKADDKDEKLNDTSSSEGSEDEKVFVKGGDKNRPPEDTEPDLFQLMVVNSYGSQDVNSLKDDEKPIRLSSQTYIACDWSVKTKQDCYNVSLAESKTDDKSCFVEEVKTKKDIDLHDCLKCFTTEKVFHLDDEWHCPQCKDMKQVTKKFDIWKLPEVLVIHLKRFSYDKYWRDKLDVFVDFPIEGLDLSSFVLGPRDDQHLYNLYAVSNHFGGMEKGHYTAFAKNHITGKWYNFDDNHVAECSEKSVVTSAAYLLFYKSSAHRRK